jgi:primary-amine oxidase
VVDERTYAPYHQHFIIARLDLDIDGEHNTVRVSEFEPLPVSADNPHGCTLLHRCTPLRTERDGRQDYDWPRQRSWIVVNEHVTNRHSTPVGYRLVPAGCVPAMFHPGAHMLRSAQGLEHALWVTPYAEDERWPCGEFVVQGEAGAGLPASTAADRTIEDTDIVLWHVFGLFHQTRPEDWPLMPADTTSFWLKPAGFFDRSPTLAR